MILTPNHRWACPNCKQTAVTHDARPHSQFHFCAGLNGIYAPMVKAEEKVKVTAQEREDYIGSEKVQLHNGRPVMSVVTERADGSNDVMVFAPSATATGDAT